jgi:hypothetical protein
MTEEAGLEVQVGNLLFVREYIGKETSPRPAGSSHGMRNEFDLRSRTGVRASCMALTCAWGTESLSSRHTETPLS